MRTYRHLARKITRTLLLAQSLGSAGFVAAATVNSIVGVELSGRATWSGVPSAIYQVGAAMAALAWGYTSDRLGRRGSLALGLLCGAVGAGLASAAVVGQLLGLFLAGVVLMGVAQAGLQLGRFAAAEVHDVAQRGRAISNVVVGGTVGSVVGPFAGVPFGRLAQWAGVDQLAGPYAASLVLFVAGAMAIALLLRPDPRDLGRLVARRGIGKDERSVVPRPLVVILQSPATMLAMAAMIFGQLTMVMVMVMTSVHMSDHHHGLHAISLVISSHTFGMFAFSVLSGRLADRWGRVPVIAMGAAALVLACLLAPLSPSVGPLAVALFLLGLGWNFCFVGGSSLLSDGLAAAERARTQGFNDLLIGLVSAAGSLGSGVAFGRLGYGSLALLGAGFALIPLMLVGWWRLGRRTVVVAR